MISSRFHFLKGFILTLILLVPLSLIAAQSTQMNYVVMIPPYQSLFDHLNFPNITVRSLLTPQDGAETFSPSPKEMTILARARTLFVSSLPFEKSLVEKIKKIESGLEVVSIVAGVELIDVIDNHSFQEQDAHIWTNPRNMDIVVENIRSILISHFPGDKVFLEAKIKELKEKLKQLDEFCAFVVSEAHIYQKSSKFLYNFCTV